MLDIKFIRDNPNLIKDAARKKHLVFDVHKFLEVDKKRLEALKGVENSRAKQNFASDEVAKIQNEKERETLINNLKQLKLELAVKEDNFRKLEKTWREMMLEVPNIPDVSVPEGINDADNVEVKRWGDIPNFEQKGFKPKNHIELLQKMGLVDFERGVKISGFRGYFLKNDAFLLSFALWRFAADFLNEKGFQLFLAPALVSGENLFGTGHFPRSQEDVYKTQDELYLSGTAEIPMTGYHSDEVLKEEDLPKKYVAFSPCYRREAGSHGKDVKGLYRLHEFTKVEQFVLCKADHNESVKWHEELTKNAEEIVQALKIPYRVVINCGGNTGQAQVKTYDIESWVPSENKYRETHSSSYYHDFQTRRLNIRYQNKEGKLRFAHSLNNTAIAVPRILIPLVENHQQKDGSIAVPEVLRKYLGKDLLK